MVDTRKMIKCLRQETQLSTIKIQKELFDRDDKKISHKRMAFHDGLEDFDRQ